MLNTINTVEISGLLLGELLDCVCRQRATTNTQNFNFLQNTVPKAENQFELPMSKINHNS